MSTCPNQWTVNDQGVCTEVPPGEGLYVTQEACNKAQNAKLEAAQCQQETAQCQEQLAQLQWRCTKGDTTDYEAMYDTTYALSITFGVLFLVALILLCVLVPLAKKGKV